jgi:hypothetical protein
MRYVRWNGDHNYSIIIAVITYSEGNATFMIVQYKKNWVVLRRFDTIFKMLKPEEERLFINPPVFGARISSSFQIVETSAIWHGLTQMERNYQRLLLHTTFPLVPR